MKDKIINSVLLTVGAIVVLGVIGIPVVMHPELRKDYALGLLGVVLFIVVATAFANYFYVMPEARMQGKEELVRETQFEFGIADSSGFWTPIRRYKFQRWWYNMARRDRLALQEFFRLIIPAWFFSCMYTSTPLTELGTVKGFFRDTFSLRSVSGFAIMAALVWIWSRFQSAKRRINRPREAPGQDVNFFIKMTLILTIAFWKPSHDVGVVGNLITWGFALMWAGGGYLVGKRRVATLMRVLLGLLVVLMFAMIGIGSWKLARLLYTGQWRYYNWHQPQLWVMGVFIIGFMPVIWLMSRIKFGDEDDNDGDDWRDIPDVPFPSGGGGDSLPVSTHDTTEAIAATTVIHDEVAPEKTTHSAHLLIHKSKA